MPEQKYKLFEISYFDKSKKVSSNEIYSAYTSAHVSATSLEKATDIAKKNAKENQEVVGVNERIGDFFHE